MSNNYFGSIIDYNANACIPNPNYIQSIDISNYHTRFNKSAVSKNQLLKTEFYDVLAKHSYFKDNKLVLDHQYVHSRIMNSSSWDEIANNVIKNMAHCVDESIAIKEYLYLSKMIVPGIRNTKTLLLLRELFIAENGNISFCKINIKNMNARMKLCLPLTYLHDFGRFSCPEIFQAVTSNEESGSISLTRKRSRSTNRNAAQSATDKKYQTIVKALFRYCANQELFINANSKLSCQQSKLVSEPEKWLAAMIAHHGYQMTAYIDQCISNLTAGYLEELKKQEKWDQLELLCSHKNAEFNVSTLMSILQDMSMLQTLSPASITDTLSTQRSALTNRKKIKGHRQPHSESQRLVAENSTSSGTSEVKTIDWLLSSITHAPDTHCTLDSQHQLDKRDDGFFDIIKPYLQPEEPINSAQFSLNLLNQPASLLSPEAIGTPIYALSSEFAVCATDSASSEEVPNSSTSARTESTLVSMSSNIAASAGVQNLADQRVTFSQWQ